MRKRVDIEFDVELLKIIAVKAAILGISRRRYLEISANVAVYNDMSDIKLSVEDYIRKQNNK